MTIFKKIYRKDKQPDGYQETIERGISAMRHLNRSISYGKGGRVEQIERLKTEIETADAIVIGAGAGLSTSAGFTYSGERFNKYFFDFAKEYGITDMYSGGFYPFPNEETFWAWWARHIYFNRYVDAPKPVYSKLFGLVKNKDYFVITTNVDHMFQKAGFDKKRLFYTQGDYGLFQSVDPKNRETIDNEDWVMKAMVAQGFCLSVQEDQEECPVDDSIASKDKKEEHPEDDHITSKDKNSVFLVPEDGRLSMSIPTELIPKCKADGSDVTMNLRSDENFLEDAGWHRASAAYSEFLRSHENMHVLYLELGVGANTPGIVKYPFWQMTAANENAVYACLNYGQAFCPGAIEDRSICIDGDIGEVLDEIMERNDQNDA